MMTTDDVKGVAQRFSVAVAKGDRGLAKACCTAAGLMPGETPAALFLDAVERGYRLQVAGEALVNPALRRGAVPTSVSKEGYPGREVWLFAELQDGGDGVAGGDGVDRVDGVHGAAGVGGAVGLSGVTGSTRVVEAFLAGYVPADARLGALPESARARALGVRVVEAHLRHGKVSDVFGSTPVAAMAAGLMLDTMLAQPGATIEVVEAKEIAGLSRAALGFSIHRPELSLPEAFWVVLELGDEVYVRATASSMTLDVLLTGITAEQVGRSSMVKHLDDRGNQRVSGGPLAASPAGHVDLNGRDRVGDQNDQVGPIDSADQVDQVDQVDRIEALLESLRVRVEGAPADVARPNAPRSLLDDELRERLTHDPAAAEAVRLLLERLTVSLPGTKDGESLGDQLRGLLGELLDGLKRTLDAHHQR